MASQQQILTLKICILITSTASAISTLCVISKYFIYKKSRTLEFLMVIILCLGDLIQAFSIEIPVLLYWNQIVPDNYSTSSSCQAQAFFQQLGLTIQFIWSSNIAYSAYKGTVTETYEQYQSREKYSLSIGIGLPLILSVIPFFTNSYGSQDTNTLNDAICYILSGNNDKIDNTIILTTFILPLIIVFIFNTLCFWKVLIYLKTQGISSLKIYLRMMLYPMILFLCQFWFLIQIIVSFNNDQLSYDYQIWCYSLSNLGGLFDCLAYGFNNHQEQIEQEDQNSQCSNRTEKNSYIEI